MYEIVSLDTGKVVGLYKTYFFTDSSENRSVSRALGYEIQKVADRRACVLRSPVIKLEGPLYFAYLIREQGGEVIDERARLEDWNDGLSWLNVTPINPPIVLRHAPSVPLLIFIVASTLQLSLLITRMILNLWE